MKDTIIVSAFPGLPKSELAKALGGKTKIIEIKNFPKKGAFMPKGEAKKVADEVIELVGSHRYDYVITDVLPVGLQNIIYWVPSSLDIALQMLPKSFEDIKDEVDEVLKAFVAAGTSALHLAVTEDPKIITEVTDEVKTFSDSVNQTVPPRDTQEEEESIDE
jgi:hypothetical protein